MNIHQSDKQEDSAEKSHRKKHQDARIKYFIQAIDIKQDRNMTRIYSVLQQIKST